MCEDIAINSRSGGAGRYEAPLYIMAAVRAGAGTVHQALWLQPSSAIPKQPPVGQLAIRTQTVHTTEDKMALQSPVRSPASPGHPHLVLQVQLQGSRPIWTRPSSPNQSITRSEHWPQEAIGECSILRRPGPQGIRTQMLVFQQGKHLI